MRLADKYVGQEFGRILGLTAAIFLGLYLIIDLFDNSSRFIELGATAGAVASYYLWLIPYIAIQVLPAAILFASLLSLGKLNRFNELVAMKMGGVNPYRIGAPILIISALLSLSALVASEYMIPLTNRRAFDIKRTRIQRLPPHGFTRENDVWYRAARHRILYISLVDVARQKLVRVSLLDFDRSFQLSRRWDAREALWDGSKWMLVDGYLRTFEDGMVSSAEPFSQKEVDLSVGPVELSRVERKPEEMDLRELRNYIRRASASGIPTEAYRVDFQTKISIPFTGLVMALFGVALGLWAKRSGLLVGMGMSLLVGLAYWILLAVGISLGHSGKLPPLVAAWGANLVFGLGGIVLLWEVRR